MINPIRCNEKTENVYFGELKSFLKFNSKIKIEILSISFQLVPYSSLQYKVLLIYKFQFVYLIKLFPNNDAAFGR